MVIGNSTDVEMVLQVSAKQEFSIQFPARQLLLGQILARPIQRFKDDEQTVGVGSRFGPSLKFPDGTGHVRAGNEVRLHVEIDSISARADFMVLGVGGQALRHLPSEFPEFLCSRGKPPPSSYNSIIVNIIPAALLYISLSSPMSFIVPPFSSINLIFSSEANKKPCQIRCPVLPILELPSNCPLWKRAYSQRAPDAARASSSRQSIRPPVSQYAGP